MALPSTNTASRLPPRPSSPTKTRSRCGSARAGNGLHARRRVVDCRLEEAADGFLDVVHLLFGLEDRLVLRDVVLDRPHLGEVERADLHVAELLDLAVGGEDPGAVGLQLAVLVHDAELD